MKILYLLAESDADELFFEAVAERITGFSFTLAECRVRRNQGYAAVRVAVKLFLQTIQRSTADGNTHFIISVDNDRAPHRWEDEQSRRNLSSNDQRKEDRYQRFEGEMHRVLGEDRSAWNAKGALAIPIEMVEAWLLLANNPDEFDDLPRFARSSDPSARQFYRSHTPPPQLKDQVKLLMAERNCSSRPEFFVDCAHELNPEQLAERSPSFRYFHDQLRGWVEQDYD